MLILVEIHARRRETKKVQILRLLRLPPSPIRRENRRTESAERVWESKKRLSEMVEKRRRKVQILRRLRSGRSLARENSQSSILFTVFVDIWLKKKKKKNKSRKETLGIEEKKSRNKKKIVVVSPYFAASAEKLVQKEDADSCNPVEVVVQRRSQRKRKSQPIENDVEFSPNNKKRKKFGESTQLTAAERSLDAYARVPNDNRWVPPFSDHELLQEFHFFDHWRVLVICMLLNRTTGQQVRRILPRLFLLCPDAKTTKEVSEEDIEAIIRPLGLQNKRARMIKRMSEEYLTQDWTHVTQLHGIGKYAADAYAIFCSGKWRDVKPNDHKLVDYWRFLMEDKDSRQSISMPKQPFIEEIQ